MAQSKELRIELSQPAGHIYGPGERITGNVIFDCPKDKKVKALTIDFLGIARQWLTYLDDDGDLRDDRPWQQLIAVTKTIIQEPHRLRRGEHTWPFEFEFPEATEPTLPPSLGREIGGEHGGVSIKYFLWAKIPALFFPEEFKIFLSYTTARSVAVPDPQIRQFVQTQQSIAGPRGILQGMRGMVAARDAESSSSSQPSSSSDNNLFSSWSRSTGLTTAVEAPTVVIAGEIMSVLMTVKGREWDEKVKNSEPYLKKVCVHLIERVRMELPNNYHAKTRNIPEFVRRIKLASQNDLNVRLYYDDPMALDDIVLLRLVEGETPVGPSFEMREIRKHYSLDFDFTIVAMGVEYDSSIVVPEIVVLSSKVRGDQAEELPQYEA